MYVCELCVCGGHQGQKVLDCLGLELQMVVRHHMMLGFKPRSSGDCLVLTAELSLQAHNCLETQDFYQEGLSPSSWVS